MWGAIVAVFLTQRWARVEGSSALGPPDGSVSNGSSSPALISADVGLVEGLMATSRRPG